MIDIRTDLIQKEFEKGCTQGLTFRRLKPSNRFIDWLFRHYYVHEHTEHFYDSEPDFDDEEFNMYLDYEFIHKRINPNSGTAVFRSKYSDCKVSCEFRISHSENFQDTFRNRKSILI